MCTHEFEKLPFVIRLVSDRYKTQQSCSRKWMKVKICSSLLQKSTNVW